MLSMIRQKFSRSPEFTFDRCVKSSPGTFNDASHHEKLAELAS